MLKHTFVVCAYKESRYLESCVRSLVNQTVKSNIIMATSTENEHIKKIAGKYNIPGYFEIRKGKRVVKNTNLIIKRMMLLPLNIKGGGKSRTLRRMSIAFGNAICCPSVTYVKKNLPSVPFDSGLKSNLDWQLWEKLSKKKHSEFVYCSKLLMGHRIHEESETSAVINDNKRSDEDYKIFRMFWPAPIAKAITKIYAGSEKSNKL